MDVPIRLLTLALLVLPPLFLAIALLGNRLLLGPTAFLVAIYAWIWLWFARHDSSCSRASSKSSGRCGAARSQATTSRRCACSTSTSCERRSAGPCASAPAGSE